MSDLQQRRERLDNWKNITLRSREKRAVQRLKHVRLKKGTFHNVGLHKLVILTSWKKSAWVEDNDENVWPHILVLFRWWAYTFTSTFVLETNRMCWTIQTHWDELDWARRRTSRELNSLSLVPIKKCSTFGLAQDSVTIRRGHTRRLPQRSPGRNNLGCCPSGFWSLSCLRCLTKNIHSSWVKSLRCDRIYYHVINRARINGAHARAYNFLFSNISAWILKLYIG